MQLDLYIKPIVPGGKNKSHSFQAFFPDIFLELQLRNGGTNRAETLGYVQIVGLMS